VHANPRSAAPAADPLAPVVVDLGRMDYARAHDRQLALHAAVRAGHSPGAILLVEHAPVFTAGRATTAAERPPQAIDSERGGRITFHGPGQLVVYPVVPLPRRDVRAWLRALEDFGAAICADFGLVATPSNDGTGVFVAGRKVASIGVAVRNWINLHGIAINVAMDLEPFARVRPCGLDPALMSDLSREAGRTISMAQARAAAAAHIDLLTASRRGR
jgi:lipoyl(octanoyl) transferase